MKATDFLTEMPSLISYNFNGRKDDISNVKYILENGKKLATFKNIDVKYFMYNNQTYVGALNGDDYFYSILSPSSFPPNSIIQNVVIRKGDSLSGITYHLIFDAYLKKYNYVLSDAVHYSPGDNVWKNIREYSLKNEFEIGIINLDTNEIIPYNDDPNPEAWFSQFKKEHDDDFKKFRYYVKRK